MILLLKPESRSRHKSQAPVSNASILYAHHPPRSPFKYRTSFPEKNVATDHDDIALKTNSYHNR